MSASGSSGTDSQKLPVTTTVAPKPPKLSISTVGKLDKLPKLTGPDNYRTWASTAEFLLTTDGCWNLVTGAEAEPTATYDKDGDLENEDDIDNFHQRYRYSTSFFLETVDHQWLPILVTYKTPQAIWTALRDKFARENTTTFYDELSTVLNLKLTNKSDIASHINKFDSSWTRIQHRCSTATATDTFDLPFVFKPVFESLTAKAALMLYSLPSSMDNIVDNLQTKDGLTYDQVYQKLMDLNSKTNHVEDKAYRVQEPHRSTSSNANSDEKECSYCKKHFPKSRWTGHLWNECHKLKAKQEKEKEKKGKGRVDTAKAVTESSKVSTDTDAVSPRTHPSSSRSTQWVIDTAASSHMTNNPDLFLNIEHHRGRVVLADQHALEVVGRGTVALQGKLPSGKSHPIVLRNVLYVPTLGQSNLLSWRVIASLGNFVLDGQGPDLFVRKERDGNIVVWGKMEGMDYVVQQMEDHARLSTYQDWHKAFGHASTTYIKPSCYTDGHLLPPHPQNFECDICTLSKSTKHVPPPTTSRATRQFELIHSDL